MDNKKQGYYSALTGFKRAVPIILGALAVFIAICFFTDDSGALGSGIKPLLLGLFSTGAYGIPLLLLIHAVFYAEDVAKKRVLSRFIFTVITVLSISAIEYSIVFWNEEAVFAPFEFFNNATAGGFIGGTVAFGLMKILGPFGIYILAAALLAIYFSFFFASKNSAFGKAVFAVLGFITGIFALIERGISAISSSRKRSKEKKRKKEIDKKNQELLDDQFFTVDDGMSELKISELGIIEDKTAKVETAATTAEIKEEPAAAEAADVPRQKRTVNLDYGLEHGLFDAVFEKDPPKSTSGAYSAPESFSAEDNAFSAPQSTERRENSVSAAYGLDESADKVFTKDFDPFDFATNEKIAAKASTRAIRDESVGVSEIARPLSAMTAEEIAEERRRSEFEKRRKMIVEMRNREASNSELTEESEVTPPETHSEAPASTFASAPASKVVEFNVSNEPRIIDRAPREGAVFKGTFDKQEHRENDAEKAAAHVAEVVAMNNPAYTRSANRMYTYMTITESPEAQKSAPEAPTEENAPLATEFDGSESKNDTLPFTSEEPRAEFNNIYMNSDEAESPSADSDSTVAVNENTETAFAEEMIVSDQARASATEESPTVEKSRDKAPVFKPYDPSAIEESISVQASPAEETLRIERTMITPTPEIIEEEPVTSPSPISERDKRYTVLSDEMAEADKLEPEQTADDESTVFTFEDQTPVEATRQTVSTNNDEGTVFSFGDEDDEEDEPAESYDQIPEEEAITSEEIPLEEQNPEVIKQRAMFPFLDGEESASETAEESNEAEEENSAPDAFSAPVAKTADEEPMPVHEDDIAEEDPISETEANEDEPPFDLGDVDTAPPTVAVVPHSEAKKEKKEAVKPDYSSYVAPPIDLLGIDVKDVEEDVEGEIQENADKLIETLASFNVTASIKGVDRGPRITRYEVVPARGVKVSSVMNLQDDIALGLAAEGIRMEAPIPGKSAIGVEIPNIHEETVRLRELLETEEFKNAKSKTAICIGKDVTGQPVINDIAKMPHLLIAGATGMGKSVCINSLMISMLYKARPDEVKFIMIDPKQVEFTMYNGIPHLLIPVVSDAKQAAGALMWAVEEMDRRYNILNTQYVRNVDAYNEKIKADPSIGEPMSRIVIVIDEFADLMLQVRDPVENLVMRIAQKARAAGIHLIIGTQRPAVNVITGTIKANVPSRISCKVASNTDSRTVLDAGGAEKLLNKGDMLFSFSGAIRPLRVQGAFVKDSEVESIMKYLKQFSNGENYDQSVMEEIERAAQKCSKKGGGSDYDDDDDQSSGEGYLNDRQFLDAVELAVNSGRIATSLIQRKLSIGYGKAAKFIDIMEDMGIVGEGNGPKPREVLISPDEWREKLARSTID